MSKKVENSGGVQYDTRNHEIQIPASVNGLTDEVMLHTELEYDFEDKKVYDFIQKYN